MAKVTDEYCRKRFYRDFARMTADQQRGVLEAFETMIGLRECATVDTPLLEETEEERDT